jgi:hypothetical protein
MSRSRDDGGLDLPPETVRTRAFLLQCFIKGLVVSAVRRPDLDPATSREAIEKAVDRLLSP